METLDGYYTASEAAEEAGINYKALLMRISRGSVKYRSIGRLKFVHRDEVARIKGEMSL